MGGGRRKKMMDRKYKKRTTTKSTIPEMKIPMETMKEEFKPIASEKVEFKKCRTNFFFGLFRIFDLSRN